MEGGRGGNGPLGGRAASGLRSCLRVGRHERYVESPQLIVPRRRALSPLNESDVGGRMGCPA